MTSSFPIPVGAAAPLFGNLWLALSLILSLVAVLLAVVALVGRRLAATHPDMPTETPGAAPVPVAPVAPAPAPVDHPSAEMLVLIAAVVAVTLGRRARVVSVVTSTQPAPSVEMLMQQWSMEGRRQIYSSHQIR